MSTMMNPRKRLQAQIHIAKKQLSLDDDTYRAMLSDATGTTSTAGMSVPQLIAVVDRLKLSGWKPKSAKSDRARPKPARDRKALMGKIEAFLSEAERPWSYADSMAKRMFKIDRCEWCDEEQLSKIVAALYYDAKRHDRFVP